MSEEKVLLRIEDNVAVVTLKCPRSAQCPIGRDGRQLSVAVSKAAKTEGVRCLLMNAAGRGFCAGANLQARGAATDLPPAGSALETHYAPLMNKLRNLSFPIVTAVNGPAAGVGMSLALTGDIVMASDTGLLLTSLCQNRIGAGWRRNLVTCPA